MKIISHRGFWKEDFEKNSFLAFERSFASGFGTETDVRDYNGKLVISHDLPTNNAIPLSNFFDLYKKFQSKTDNKMSLALNIKSDGLQSLLKLELEKYEITNYFVFDMAVPDIRGYLRLKVNSYTRQSEEELKPSFYNECNGVWVDQFYSNWINHEILDFHLEHNKNMCFVSSELHNRDPIEFWKMLKEYNRINCDNIILCTDQPEMAKEFFNAK